MKGGGLSAGDKVGLSLAALSAAVAAGKLAHSAYTRRRAPSPGAGPTANIRAELDALPISSLRKWALRAGVDEDKVYASMDAAEVELEKADRAPTIETAAAASAAAKKIQKEVLIPLIIAADPQGVKRHLEFLKQDRLASKTTPPR